MNDSFEEPVVNPKPAKVAKPMATMSLTKMEPQSPMGMKKVVKTFQDDEGFLVVEKVLVPVTSDDQQAPPVKAKVEPRRAVGNSGAPASKQTKKMPPAPAKGKQTNIMSFFAKNP